MAVHGLRDTGYLLEGVNVLGEIAEQLFVVLQLLDKVMGWRWFKLAWKQFLQQKR